VSALTSDLDAHIAIERPPEPGPHPHTVVNMVASVDGRITVGARVGTLTSPIDQRLLAGLRAQADVVLVGAATVRAEGYGRLLPDDLRAERASRGLPPEPLLCVVSRTLDFDPMLAAFQNPELRIVIATGSHALLPPVKAGVDYLRYTTVGGNAPLAQCLADLAEQHDARVCVCEGGPGVAAELVQADVCDELFVSVAPQLVGGEGRVGLLSPALHNQRTLRLRSLAEGDDHVFLRYAVE
jgi:riboflavin biosynthesis pyrimidine reductase